MLYATALYFDDAKGGFLIKPWSLFSWQLVILLIFDLFIFNLLQAGLFVYDIFWVFFTPVMVSVAKSFDAPIKVSC
jgi:hypothetical protein